MTKRWSTVRNSTMTKRQASKVARVANAEVIEGDVGREVWSLRGGSGFDYPCERPEITECAMFECQKIGRCRFAPQPD